MTVTLTLAVVVAGGLGALGRQLLNDAIAHRVRVDFPLGILTINLLGSFALGLLSGLALYHGLPADALVVGGTGICGGFTTWSTSIWETLQLLRLRLYGQAPLHGVGGLALGLGAAAAGAGLAALT